MKTNNEKETVLNKIIDKAIAKRLVSGGKFTDAEMALIHRAIKSDFKMIGSLNIYKPTQEEFNKLFRRLNFTEDATREVLGVHFDKNLFDSVAVASNSVTEISASLEELYELMYKAGYRQIPAKENDLTIESFRDDIKVIFDGELRFNTITNKIEFVGFAGVNNAEYKTMIDSLADTLYSYCRPKYRAITRDLIYQEIRIVAEQNSYNPVTEMLNSSQWDGIDRYPIVYKYLQQDDTKLQGIIKKWLIQCVAMAFNDGDKCAATVLTLLGPQGVGKTQFFHRLTPNKDWFESIASFDPKNKDSLIIATSCWIGELAEVESMYRRDQDAIKAFISAKKDTYRRPYDREFTTAPRTACFGATVNKTDFIADDEARRWLVVEMNDYNSLAMQEELADNALQIWAQVYQDYLKSKDGYHLSTDEIDLLKRRNANNYTRDMLWEDAILSIEPYREGFTATHTGKYDKITFSTIFGDVIDRVMHKDFDNRPAIGGKEYKEMLAAARSLAARYKIRITKDKGQITFNLVKTAATETAPF